MWCDITGDGHTCHNVWHRHDTCHIVVIYITVIVTWLDNIKKNIKGSRIDNIIQYSNNMLAL